MMKVCNVISDMNIGGAGKVVLNFAKNYDKSKYELFVIVPNGSALVEEFKRIHVRVIEIDGMKDKSWDIKAFFKLVQILKKEKPDIVHTHASSIARLAARCIKHVKIIYTRHCAYPVSDSLKRGIRHFLYKHTNEYFSDHIIAVGKAAEENLLDGGISKDMIDTFYNGVEKITELSKEEKKKLRKKYHIEDNEKVVGIIARLEKVKGHDTFLKAAKTLVADSKMNFKFFIIGTGSEEEEIKQEAKNLKIEDKVIFTGFVNNVGEFLNIFDVQVNCSYGTETSSLSLLEGMSIGVPAVVTDYGGNPYLISNEENGYVVPVHAPRETADAILKILENEEIRNKMKQKSLEIFEERFTVKKFTNHVENVYEKVMNKPSKRRINLLDILIITIFIVVGITGYSFLKKDKVAVILPTTQKVIYQIRTNQSIAEVYDYIELNTPIYDNIKNAKMGTVISKQYEPSERFVLNQQTNEVEKNLYEDRIDIILKIEADAVITDKDISIGDYIIKTGNEAFIRGKGYEAAGYIVSIER